MLLCWHTNDYSNICNSIYQLLYIYSEYCICIGLDACAFFQVENIWNGNSDMRNAVYYQCSSSTTNTWPSIILIIEIKHSLIVISMVFYKKMSYSYNNLYNIFYLYLFLSHHLLHLMFSSFLYFSLNCKICCSIFHII